MLQPKRVKYRKVQKGKGQLQGISNRGHRLSNGMFGIKSLEQKLDYSPSNRSSSCCGYTLYET